MKGKPEHVKPAAKEAYLTDEEFEKVFKMDRAKFDALKDWKRTELKKSVGLF